MTLKPAIGRQAKPKIWTRLYGTAIALEGEFYPVQRADCPPFPIYRQWRRHPEGPDSEFGIGRGMLSTIVERIGQEVPPTHGGLLGCREGLLESL